MNDQTADAPPPENHYQELRDRLLALPNGATMVYHIGFLAVDRERGPLVKRPFKSVARDISLAKVVDAHGRAAWTLGCPSNVRTVLREDRYKQLYGEGRGILTQKRESPGVYLYQYTAK